MTAHVPGGYVGEGGVVIRSEGFDDGCEQLDFSSLCLLAYLFEIITTGMIFTFASELI